MMLSNYGCNPSEGWSFVDQWPINDTYIVASNPNHDANPLPRSSITVKTNALVNASTRNITWKAISFLANLQCSNSTATVNYLMNNNGNKEEFKENTRKGELLWYAASYLYRTKQPTFLNQSLVHLINEQLSTRFNKTKTLRLLRLIKRWDHDLLVHVWAKEIRQLDGSELQLNKDK